ncbi:hypothetical protein HPP92_010656 [Vanilla planifolia]|uniref:Uncharacterized protein n=1 Tax=Vanilla planifolia TaxID=51239 RepID=A0A835V216_VANPL|nr:hypothetical protein HPP92_010656 [Vanilla planifolia]
MDQNSQRWGTHRTIYPESRRSFYPKPPYVKPVVTHVKSGKSKTAHQDYNGHHLTDELFGEKTQKPIFREGTPVIGYWRQRKSEFNHSKQTEDVSSYKRRMNRTLSEQPRYHGYKNADEEEEMMDKYLMHYSKKGSDHVPGKGGTLAGEYQLELIWCHLKRTVKARRRAEGTHVLFLCSRIYGVRALVAFIRGYLQITVTWPLGLLH